MSFSSKGIAAAAAVAIASGLVHSAPVTAAEIPGITQVSASARVTSQTLSAVKAKIKATGRTRSAQAAVLVRGEVPGTVESISPRTRLGLKTWRVIVEVDGYRVAAFVDQKSGIIIDWRVLDVPPDVEFIPGPPPAKDATAPTKPNGTPLPAEIPLLIDEALRAQAVAAQAPPPAAPSVATPAPTSSSGSPSRSSDGDGDGDDGNDHGNDSGDDEGRGDHRESDGGHDGDHRGDNRDDHRQDDSNDHRDDGGSGSSDGDRSDDHRDD